MSNQVWKFDVTTVSGTPGHGSVVLGYMEIRENTIIHMSDSADELKGVEGQFSGDWYCGGLLDMAHAGHPHIIIVRKNAENKNYTGKIIDLSEAWSTAGSHNKTFHNP